MGWGVGKWVFGGGVEKWVFGGGVGKWVFGVGGREVGIWGGGGGL